MAQFFYFVGFASALVTGLIALAATTPRRRKPAPDGDTIGRLFVVTLAMLPGLLIALITFKLTQPSSAGVEPRPLRQSAGVLVCESPESLAVASSAYSDAQMPSDCRRILRSNLIEVVDRQPDYIVILVSDHGQVRRRYAHPGST